MLHRGSEASVAVTDLWHSYVLRRIGQSVIVLLIMSFVIYALIGLIPGDPLDIVRQLEGGRS